MTKVLEQINCECGHTVPVTRASLNEDGQWSCDACLEEYRKELEKNKMSDADWKKARRIMQLKKELSYTRDSIILALSGENVLYFPVSPLMKVWERGSNRLANVIAYGKCVNVKYAGAGAFSSGEQMNEKDFFTRFTNIDPNIPEKPDYSKPFTPTPYYICDGMTLYDKISGMPAELKVLVISKTPQTLRFVITKKKRRSGNY